MFLLFKQRVLYVPIKLLRHIDLSFLCVHLSTCLAASPMAPRSMTFDLDCNLYAKNIFSEFLLSGRVLLLRITTVFIL